MDRKPVYGAISDGYRTLLQQAKRALLEGTPAVDAAIPVFLLQSWRRSHVVHGIDPADQLLTAPDSHLHVIDEQDRYLSAIAGQEIDSIWDSFGGANWVVYVTNEQSVIVRARHGSNPASRSFTLQVGRRLQEGDIGTTAPACALREGRSLTLVGAEHFLDEFAHLFCCAVPVWGPWGTVVGVINITGSEEFKSSLVETKLTSAAVKVENRLFLDAHRANQVIRIHHDADFIDTYQAGLMAINGYGDILSVTRSAAQMLDHIDPFRQRFNVTDLFVDELLIDGQCLQSSLKNGIVFYTKGHLEGGVTPAHAMPVTRHASSLREMSELHMLETLRKTNGNVSQAAKLLGLSRTTLYRVLNKQMSRKPDDASRQDSI